MPSPLFAIASAAALAVPVHGSGGEDTAPAASELELIEGAADRYARLTVPVMIDGEGPFDFMVDTGSQSTIVSRQLGEQLGLETVGEATLVGIAGSENVDLVEIDAFAFGAQEVGTVVAPLLERDNVGADGIVGLDSLHGMRVMMDFRENALVVGESPDANTREGYEIVVRARRKLGRLIISNASIDGVRTAVIVDTGSQASIGNRALLRRMRVARRNGRDIVTSEDVTGARITGQVNTARLMRIGRMQLRGLPIGFADAPIFETLDLMNRPALILGMEDLRMLDRVAIDFETDRVLFDIPAGYRDATKVGRQFFPSRIKREEPR